MDNFLLFWYLYLRLLWETHPALFDLHALGMYKHQLFPRIAEYAKNYMHLIRTERTDMCFVFYARRSFSHAVSLIPQSHCAVNRSAYAVSGPMRLELIIYLRRSARRESGWKKHDAGFVYGVAVIPVSYEISAAKW